MNCKFVGQITFQLILPLNKRKIIFDWSEWIFFFHWTKYAFRKLSYEKVHVNYTTDSYSLCMCQNRTICILSDVLQCLFSKVGVAKKRTISTEHYSRRSKCTHLTIWVFFFFWFLVFLFFRRFICYVSLCELLLCIKIIEKKEKNKEKDARKYCERIDITK